MHHELKGGAISKSSGKSEVGESSLSQGLNLFLFNLTVCGVLWYWRFVEWEIYRAKDTPSPGQHQPKHGFSTLATTGQAFNMSRPKSDGEGKQQAQAPQLWQTNSFFGFGRSISV
jgi:hypothetical protein